MQSLKNTLTETERNTVFVTIHGYEFRLWFNRLEINSTPFWQIDAREFDGTWSYYSHAFSLTEAFNHVRVATGL